MNLIEFVDRISDASSTRFPELITEHYEQMLSLYYAIQHLPEEAIEDIGPSVVNDGCFCIPLFISEDANIDEIWLQLEDTTELLSFSIDKKQNCINCKLQGSD